MASQSESDMGINSWLEDELYQQYLHDRSAVDESWKDVFAEPRPAATAPRQPRPHRPKSLHPRPNPHPASNSAAARRRRTHRREYGGQRLDSARHLAAHHRRQGDGREPAHHQSAPHAGRPRQSLLHAPHRLGHRQGPGRNPRTQPRLRRARRPAVPRAASAGQPRHRGRRRRARTARAA